MKNIRPLRFVAILATLIVLATVAWQWAANTERRVITVGFYENAPKIYTDANGHPAGLFVELLNEIARAEGWTLRYVPCEWVYCLGQLKQGTLDLMPDVAFSSERVQHFDFHNVSVASSWSQVYSRPDLKALSLADLAGQRIAVLQGGIQQSFFAQLMASGHYAYQPVLVNSLDQGYAAVVSGEADVVVTNSFFAAHNGSKYRLQETPIVFLPTNLYFATGKGRNADVLEHIDVHLTDWRRDSTSLYFEALHRAMALPPEVLVPHWMRKSLFVLGVGLLLLLTVSLLLRWQVNQRTQALMQTTRELEDQRANLEQQVTERTDELLAEAYCHALKGVAGNLSATALYAQVAAIDAGLKQGQRPDAATWEALSVRLQAVIDDIDRLAVHPAPALPPAAAPLDPVTLGERLERLAHALDYDLGAAEPLILELRASVSGTPLEPDLAALAAQIDVFAIDEALTQLHTLQERLKLAI